MQSPPRQNGETNNHSNNNAEFSRRKVHSSSMPAYRDPFASSSHTPPIGQILIGRCLLNTVGGSRLEKTEFFERTRRVSTSDDETNGANLSVLPWQKLRDPSKRPYSPRSVRGPDENNVSDCGDDPILELVTAPRA